MCKNFLEKGFCKYGNKCAFAHSMAELRSKVAKTTAYKTEKRENFHLKGYCSYGERCQYVHLFNYSSYQKTLDTLNSENIICKNGIKGKPRLAVFSSLSHYNESENENKKSISKLYEDIKKIDLVYKRVNNEKDNDEDVDDEKKIVKNGL